MHATEMKASSEKVLETALRGDEGFEAVSGILQRVESEMRRATVLQRIAERFPR